MVLPKFASDEDDDKGEDDDGKSVIFISCMVRMTFSRSSNLLTSMHWPVGSNPSILILDLEKKMYSHGPRCYPV